MALVFNILKIGIISLRLYIKKCLWRDKLISTFCDVLNICNSVMSDHPKDQFRQNTFGDESCRGLTMKAMRCLIKGFSLEPLLKMPFLKKIEGSILKNVFHHQFPQLKNRKVLDDIGTVLYLPSSNCRIKSQSVVINSIFIKFFLTYFIFPKDIQRLM